MLGSRKTGEPTAQVEVVVQAAMELA
ncbi:MAG: hypothetical protein FD127_1675, partial [Acidimicrobiaceae bacterium]